MDINFKIGDFLIIYIVSCAIIVGVTTHLHLTTRGFRKKDDLTEKSVKRNRVDHYKGRVK